MELSQIIVDIAWVLGGSGLIHGGEIFGDCKEMIFISGLQITGG